MSRQLDPADEELLQSALFSSFTRLPPRATASEATPGPALPLTTPSAQPVPEQPASSTPSAVDASANVEDSFKDEYDRQLAAWRAEAEITRAKAERTRAEWEIRRKAEEEEEQQRVAAEEARREEKRESTLAGWETVSPTDDSKPVHGASAGGGIGTSDEQAAAQRVSAAQEAARQHVQTFGVDAQTPEPSPTDARDLVSGERPRSSGISGLSFPKSSPPTGRAERITPPGIDSEMYTSEEDERRSSRHWEEIPSLASSFPSLPDNVMSSSSSQNDKVSPKTAKSIPSGFAHHKHGDKPAKHHDDQGDHEHRRHSHSHHDHHGSAIAASNRVPLPSVTLSIFSPGLSARARALAIASSIAINFVLPFINGVMLGFGEIFAKNFVAPLFGIRIPSVANVGVRARTKDWRR